MSSCAIAGSSFSFDCVSDPLLHKDAAERQGTVITIDEAVLWGIKLWSPTQYTGVWWKADKLRELIKWLFLSIGIKKKLLLEDFWNEELVSIIWISCSFGESCSILLLSMSSTCLNQIEAWPFKWGKGSSLKVKQRFTKEN